MSHATATQWILDRDYCFKRAVMLQAPDELASDVSFQVATKVDEPRFDEVRDRGAAWHRYLTRCTRNALCDEYRRIQRRERLEIATGLDPESGHASTVADPTSEPLLRLEARSLLAEAMLTLNDRERECITFRFFRELSVPNISDRLQIDETTVRRNIKRALEKLRLELAYQADNAV